MSVIVRVPLENFLINELNRPLNIWNNDRLGGLVASARVECPGINVQYVSDKVAVGISLSIKVETL